MSSSEGISPATAHDAAVLPAPMRLPFGAAGEDRRLVATGYGPRDFWTRRVLALADALGIMAALALSAVLTARGDLGEHMLWGLGTLPMWLVLFTAYGLYDRDAKRVSHTTVDDIPWLFHALVIGALLSWGYFKLASGSGLVLAEALAFGGISFVALLALRGVGRAVAVRLLPRERVLVVGEEELTSVLARKINAHPEYGLDLAGLIGTSPAAPNSDLPVLGALGDLRRVVVDNGIDRILVSATALDGEEQLELLRRCRQLSLKVSLVPQVFDAMGPSVAIDDVEGVTVLGMNPPVLARSSRFLKRALDIAGSGIMLTLLAPVMATLAVAIRLDTPGPVFFRQQRVGKDGRVFWLLKFRTMVQDAERLSEELLAASKDPHWLLIDQDPRITAVGRRLRVLSLDELPQLWNVLKGEMSLVGPRPMPLAQDCLISGWGRARVDLTPGITGLWQVLGRTTISFEEMVKLDYLYVLNWSLWQDVRLLLRTGRAVVGRRGAN
jgi:exopolysaccharide biosynthesis polyprenyl glycosylphosphotransferase